LFHAGNDPQWRNRIIWGDKKYVLAALLEEYASRVDLVYIDPPFATGQNFSLPVRLDGNDFTKEPSIIETKAYRDTWGQGLDSYLRWFYEMAVHLHALLASSGSLYVHLDPGVSHSVKVLLDEVFGADNFRNEIAWKRTTAHSSANRYGPLHDVLLFYTKSSTYTCNKGFHKETGRPRATTVG
jgi:adenine-specific DNA-methyltransferase